MITVIAYPPLTIGLGLAGVDQVIEITTQTQEQLKELVAQLNTDILITHDKLYEKIREYVIKKPFVTISLPDGAQEEDEVDRLIKQLA